MKSFIVVTDNSEDYIYDVLCSLLPLRKDEQLIIFDNHSTDNTVPKIVEAIGIKWVEEDKYKLYINVRKESKRKTRRKALKITDGVPIFINKKERFDFKEVIGDA